MNLTGLKTFSMNQESPQITETEEIFFDIASQVQAVSEFEQKLRFKTYA